MVCAIVERSYWLEVYPYVVQSINCINFAKKIGCMTFDDITGRGNLWAVRYDGDEDNRSFE